MSTDSSPDSDANRQRIFAIVLYFYKCFFHVFMFYAGLLIVRLCFMSDILFCLFPD